MDDDYDGIDGDDFFEQDGPGLFGADEPAATGGPAVDEEPDGELLDGLADVPAGGAPVADTATPTPAPPVQSAHPAVEHDVETAPLALYRRYRPDTFAEVIGQEHVTEPLQRALQNNKVNHAYLFSGPRGCGKTTSARILARCLNCEQGPTPTPCGTCQSCRDLARGGSGSIDVIEIDAASHGGVDDTRELRERAFFAPVHSRYKIYIIDEAHMVTTAGFNAMLKLVEEPPPHVKFIFATTEPEKVIGTIRSRTHHYPFRLVPPKVLQNYLAELCTREGVPVDHTVLPLVVRAGAGSVRDSLSVLDQLLGGAGPEGVSYQQASALLGYTPDALLDEIVDAFAAGDAAGVFGTIDKVVEVGQDPRRFAEDLLRRLRDLVIVAAVPDAVSSGLIDVAGDQAERLETQASGMGAGELTRAAEVIATGLTEMRGTTAPRLFLELMCSRVLLPGADVDDRGLHARLDRLERRVGMAGAPVDVAEARWSDDDLAGSPSHARPTPVPEPAPRPSTPQLAAPPQHYDDAPPAPPVAQRPAAETTAPAGAGQRPAAASGLPPAPAQRAAGAPQGQRPAGSAGLPAGRPAPSPVEEAPAPAAAQQPVAQQQAAGQAAPSAPAAPAGGLGVTDVRRLWPQVLEEVKGRRRFAWILLSQNAQVVDANQGTLVLGFSNAGARDSFMSGGSSDVLRDSIVEVLGADLRIDAIVENGTTPAPSRGGHGTPAPQQAPAQQAPAPQPQAPTAQAPQTASSVAQSAPQPGAGQPVAQQPAAPEPSAPSTAPAAAAAAGGRADDVPMPSEPDDDVPPEDDERPTPRASVPSGGAPAGGAPQPPRPAPAADTHRWTDEAKQNIRPTATGPAVVEEVDDEALVSDDDEVLDESGESASELIVRALGGVVIEEQQP